MPAPQVVFITGKGGVGKTTVTAALAVQLAATRRRVLIVETDRTGRLAELFGVDDLGSEPALLKARVFAVRVQPRTLLEEYFHSLLRVPFLARGLLSSRAFNAITAAAPGVTEFLLLEKLLQWIEPGWGARRRFDTVLVDGPATGHALKLLSAPRTIASLVPAGPIGTVARRALALLADHRRTHVLIVTLPEELVITETLEAYDALANDLALNVARPVINRVFPRRFTPRDIEELDAAGNSNDLLTAAARFQLARRREADRHMSRLRRAIQRSPLALPMLFDEQLRASHLGRLGASLASVLE